MSERSASILLEDMRDASARIARYVHGKDATAFLADEQCEDACVRNLEIIGEAASRLPEEFLSAHPEVDRHQAHGDNRSHLKRTSPAVLLGEHHGV